MLYPRKDYVTQDVHRVYPLRNTSDEMMGFSLDIKSVHKLVVIRPSDR